MKRLAARVWDSPTLMTWASLFVRIGGVALLLPVILAKFSSEEVLVWQVISTITALVVLADFGVSPTFSRVIAHARGGGTLGDFIAGSRGHFATAAPRKELDLHQVFVAQSGVYARLLWAAAALVMVGGTLAVVRPIAALQDPGQGWIAWIAGALASILLLMNTANASILVGFDQIASTRRVDTIVGTCQLLSTAVVAYLGFGLAIVVFWYALWTVPLFALNRQRARRAVRSVLPRPTESSPQELSSAVWRSAWRSGVGMLASTGIIQASGLIYAQLAPPAEAAAYLLLLRALTAVSQISQAPFYSKLPLLARLRAEGRRNEVVAMAARGMLASHSIFVSGALTLVAVIPWALSALSSSVQLPAPLICATLISAFFMERYGAMHMQVYSLTHHIVWHIVNGLTGVLMVLFAVALYPALKLQAFPVSMLAAYCAFYCWRSAQLSLRSLPSRWIEFERKTSFTPGLLLLAGLAVYLSASAAFPAVFG